MSPVLQGEFLNTGPQESPLFFFFKIPDLLIVDK